MDQRYMQMRNIHIHTAITEVKSNNNSNVEYNLMINNNMLCTIV